MPETHYGVVEQGGHWIIIGDGLRFGHYADRMTAERAARDLGAPEWKVLTLISAPMLAAPLAAAFFLSVTFSWDEFIIAFLLTRFDTTLPVEIWNMLRAGLNPKTNAVGAMVFGVFPLIFASGAGAGAGGGDDDDVLLGHGMCLLALMIRPWP